MSLVSAEAEGGINLPIVDYFLEKLAARTVAKVSGEFAKHLERQRFNELFEDRTGKTKKSIGAYRDRSRVPAYIVKAGLGIPESLNYLAGLYRGRAVSRSGNPVSYSQRRDLINGGWKAWGGDGKINAAYEEMLKKVIGESEAEIGS